MIHVTIWTNLKNMLSKKALHKRKHPLWFRLCKGTVQAQLIQENKMREVDRARVGID